MRKKTPAVVTFAVFLAVFAMPVFAANPQLVVDLSTVTKTTADHAGSGALYGLRNDVSPKDQAIVPLRPKMIAQPPANPGMIPNQPYEVGPVGDAIVVSGKAKRLGIKQIQIYMSDCYPNFPQHWISWSDYYAKLDAEVDAVKNSSYPQGYFVYIPWNEPDWTWNNPNNSGTDFNTAFGMMVARIKTRDTTNLIEGPNTAVYNHNFMLSFLSYCVAQNCVPDIISFHSLDTNTIQNFEAEVDDCRAVMASLGISERPISINEYIQASDLGKPGIAVRYLAKFERKLVASAAMPFWFRCGTFGDTLSGELNVPNGNWWLYKFYGDMLGKMVKVTAPSATSVLDGMASVDTDSQQIKVVFGGAAGNNDIVLNNVSSTAPFISGAAHVVMYKTFHTGSTSAAMIEPAYVYQGEYAVSNNTITIPMFSMSADEAYELIIIPSTTAAAYVSNRYEAEYAQWDGSARVMRDHTSYSGTGFVAGYFGSNNAVARFIVGREDDGVYPVTVRYSAGPLTGVSAGRTVGLYVNGIKVKDLTLSGTSDWNTWASSTANLFLTRGVNTIEYKAEKTDDSDCVNLDYVDLPSVTTYQAENAALSGTAAVATNHTRFTGTGFAAGYENSTTATTAFSVSAASAGSYRVSLRYSAGAVSGWSTDRTVGLYVNGTKVQDLICFGTGDWEQWGTVSTIVSLNAGTNTVSYKAEKTDNSDVVNLDRIDVSQVSGYSVYEAESATRAGTAVVSTNHSWYSGSGFVAGYDSSTTAATTFSVPVNSTGTYNIALRYSAGEQYLQSWPANRVVGLYVNGTKIEDLSLTGTVTWDEWDNVVRPVSLNAGSNTIAFKAEKTDNSDCINLDRLVVFPVP